MEQINLRAGNSLANVDKKEETTDDPVRTLRDLELMLVGGGDGQTGWP